jgi:glycosyltransferase involved in cell wall biosynthesis
MTLPRTPPPADPGAVSVVIAARNEAMRLPALLAQLASAPELVREVLVVDGGSRDATVLAARLAGAQVLRTQPGRGQQLGLGARLASAPWLLLLHADVQLPAGWAARLTRAIQHSPARGCAYYFELAIEGGPAALRLVEGGVRLRSRWWQQPYGDQGCCCPWRCMAPWGDGAPATDGGSRSGAAPRPPGAPAEPRPGAAGGWAPLAAARRVAHHLDQPAAAPGLAPRRFSRTPGPALLRRSLRLGPQRAYQKAQRRCSGSRSQPWPA